MGENAIRNCLCMQVFVKETSGSSLYQKSVNKNAIDSRSGQNLPPQFISSSNSSVSINSNLFSFLFSFFTAIARERGKRSFGYRRRGRDSGYPMIETLSEK